MKVLIFIPVYLPNTATLKNISKFTECGYRVILQLNSPLHLDGGKNIVMLGDGTNIGISRSINKVLYSEICCGFEWLLFLDQDTAVDFEKLNSHIAKMGQVTDENIAAYYMRSRVFGDREIGEFVTNSGTMFNIEYLRLMGGFNENYSVDGLDYDVCIKIWLHKFKIYNIPAHDAFDHDTLQDGMNINFGRRNFNLRRYGDTRYNELDTFYYHSLLALLNKREYFLFTRLVRSFTIYRIGKILNRIRELKIGM